MSKRAPSGTASRCPGPSERAALCHKVVPAAVMTAQASPVPQSAQILYGMLLWGSLLSGRFGLKYRDESPDR